MSTPNSELMAILEKVFVWGVGTNADDIRGNETAYLNLKDHALTEAHAAIVAWVDQKLENLSEDLGIYPPTNGHCKVCGQRPYQHTCDQAIEAILRQELNGV